MRHDVLITAKVCHNQGTNSEVVGCFTQHSHEFCGGASEKRHLRPGVLYGIAFCSLSLLHQVETCCLDNLSLNFYLQISGHI